MLGAWPIAHRWKFLATSVRAWKLPDSTLLALFRALDRMDLSPEEIPQGLLRQLFEKDPSSRPRHRAATATLEHLALRQPTLHHCEGCAKAKQ
jgi:hypothetical protein